MRLYSVTLNYRHFNFVPVQFHDKIYTFDFGKDTDEYTAEDVIPGTVDITDGSSQKINGFYTSQDKYTFHVSANNVLPGYYLKELRFYDNTDARVAKFISYPMDKTGGILTIDNDFLVKYGEYTVDGGEGSRNFLIQPVFVRDPATLTVSINDSDKGKGEVMGINFDSSVQTKTFTKNNTNKIDLHEGDKVMLTSVGTGGNAVTGYYISTGDGTVSGKKTEAVGEHSAGVVTLSLARTNVVTPIFGERTLTIKRDPNSDPSLSGVFTINGKDNFTTEGKLTDVKSGQTVDIAVIPPAGYTTQWVNRSGDTNGNGVLDDNEVRDENGTYYRQYDYNGDGVMDADYKTALYGDLFSYRVNQPQTLLYYSFVPLSGLLRYSGKVTGFIKTKEYNIYQDSFVQAVDYNGKKIDKLIPVAGATVKMGGTYDPSIQDAQIAYAASTDSNGKFTLDVTGVLKNSPYILSISQNDASFFVDSANPSLSGYNYIVPPFASMRPVSISAKASSSSKKDTVSGNVININKGAEVSFVLGTASLESNIKVSYVDFRLYNQDGTLTKDSVQQVSMQKAKWTVTLDDAFEQNGRLMVQLIDQHGNKTIEYDTGFEFRPPLSPTTMLPSFAAPMEKSIPILGTVTGALGLGLANLEDNQNSGTTYTIQMGYEHAFDDYEKVLKDTITEAEEDSAKGEEAREKIKKINEAGGDNKKSDSNVKTKSVINNNLSVGVSLKMVINYDSCKSEGSPYYFGQLLLMATLKDRLSYSTTVVLPVGLSVVTTLTVGGSVTGFINITPITKVGEIEPMRIYADENGNYDYTDSDMFKSNGYSFHTEGGVILQPKIHLKIEGDYSVGSVEVNGDAEFFLVFTTDHNDRGTVTLNADISVKVLGVEVYGKTFADWSTSLFGVSEAPSNIYVPEADTFAPVSREYLKNRSEWQGNDTPLMEGGSGTSGFTERSLLTGVYPDSDIQLARIDENSILMVFIDDDQTRTDYNRSALYYSISHDNGVTYSEPVILSDDGTLDSHPRLVDLGDQILCLYSSMDTEINSDTTMESIFEANGLEMKFFDKTSGQFTGKASDVTHYTGTPGTDNEGALLGDYTSDENGAAVYDPISGRTLIIYTKSDYTSADADRAFSAKDLFDTKKNYSAIAYRIYDAAAGEFLTYDTIGYPDGVTTEEQKAQWNELWYGQKFLDTEIIDGSLPGGGIKDPLVYDLTAARKGQTVYIAYTVDMDNDLSTTLDRDIYLTTYNFADNTFTKAVKASDIYDGFGAHADGRPQLVLYNNSMFLFTHLIPPFATPTPNRCFPAVIRCCRNPIKPLRAATRTTPPTITKHCLEMTASSICFGRRTRFGAQKVWNPVLRKP
jgi:hypothetical protein